jgi:hypothetical protein
MRGHDAGQRRRPRLRRPDARAPGLAATLGVDLRPRGRTGAHDAARAGPGPDAAPTPRGPESDGRRAFRSWQVFGLGARSTRRLLLSAASRDRSQCLTKFVPYTAAGQLRNWTGVRTGFPLTAAGANRWRFVTSLHLHEAMFTITPPSYAARPAKSIAAIAMRGPGLRFVAAAAGLAADADSPAAVHASPTMMGPRRRPRMP